jgi:transposase
MNFSWTIRRQTGKVPRAKINLDGGCHNDAGLATARVNCSVFALTVLGPKEAEMRIIGCDLHARQQTVAMLDTTTGKVVKMTLTHEGNNVREFYSKLPHPVRTGIEATGSMQWFVNLMEELGIECRVGHPAEIRAAEPRKQKHDRRDADLILKLLVENRFPAIWLPSKELQDLRALLRHRHQWVRMRTRIQNALRSIALANGLRRGTALWSHDGQDRIASLPLAPHTAYRRSELQAMYAKFEAEIEKLNQRVEEQACGRAGARLLMTHPGVGPVTALATEVFLGNPARFADSKALASYVGMIPREYSGGERQRLGGLSKQGNPLLILYYFRRVTRSIQKVRSAQCYENVYGLRALISLDIPLLKRPPPRFLALWNSAGSERRRILEGVTNRATAFPVMLERR